MPNVGPWEVFLLLLLALLLFGAKRLPEIGKSMGKGFREFKDSVSGKMDDDDDDVPELPAASTLNDATTKTEEPVVARERERDTA
jgi:sec-independent protein translocase protein TatA